MHTAEVKKLRCTACTMQKSSIIRLQEAEPHSLLQQFRLSLFLTTISVCVVTFSSKLCHVVHCPVSDVNPPVASSTRVYSTMSCTSGDWSDLLQVFLLLDCNDSDLWLAAETLTC